MTGTNYLASLPATAPVLALRRHWLGQSLPNDRATLAACLTAIGSHRHPLDGRIADSEVCLLAGVQPNAPILAIEALHGGRLPTANMAIAMALDAIDGTPGQWVSGVDEECRWEQQEDDGYREPDDDDEQEAQSN
jgi:hypothetical protein